MIEGISKTVELEYYNYNFGSIYTHTTSYKLKEKALFNTYRNTDIVISSAVFPLVYDEQGGPLHCCSNNLTQNMPKLPPLRYVLTIYL